MNFQQSFDEIDEWQHELRRTHAGSAIIRAIENRIEHESDPVRLRILNFLLADEHIAQGNEAAAEAIRRQDPCWEIDSWYDAWPQSNPESDIVPVIEERIRRETHPMKLSTLRFCLAQEHRLRGNYELSEAVYLKMFEEDPDDPMPLIILAEHKLLGEDHPDEAVRIIDRAIEAALRSGTYRRHALGVKARIALRLVNYRVLESVLRQIMELNFTRGNVDVGCERDFLDRLPPGSIDPVVAREYDEYCRAKGKLPPVI